MQLPFQSQKPIGVAFLFFIDISCIIVSRGRELCIGVLHTSPPMFYDGGDMIALHNISHKAKSPVYLAEVS